jgi:hypothetical protein
VRELLVEFGLDPEAETPGRQVVRHIGTSLVKAMEMALSARKPEAAQLVTTECVLEAETKDHLNWELIGQLAKEIKGAEGKALKEAHEKVRRRKTSTSTTPPGWTRELWNEALGLPAVLPPPEEEKDVKTAIGAAGATRARKEML